MCRKGKSLMLSKNQLDLGKPLRDEIQALRAELKAAEQRVEELEAICQEVHYRIIRLPDFRLEPFSPEIVYWRKLCQRIEKYDYLKARAAGREEAEDDQGF